MSDQEKANNVLAKGLSRRRFMQAASGAAALSASGLLVGCNAGSTQEPASGPAAAASSAPSQANATGAGSQGTASSGERTFAVHESDVLIIGGGLAGLTAAQKAMADGANVIIVDKGPFGHSGTSGINWGHDLFTNEWMDDDGSSFIVMGLTAGMAQQQYALSVAKTVKEARFVMTNAKMGAIMDRKKEDGSLRTLGYPGPVTWAYGCFPRMWAQYAKRKGAKIFDRTMVTDILLAEDGSAAGAVAIDLVNGEAFVFRAKATIMATGSYDWCFGWRGTAAQTLGGPENTGDGDSMFLRMGLSMLDMELQTFDCVQIYPDSLAFGMGAMGLSVVNSYAAYNKDHKQYTDGGKVDFYTTTLKEIINGRGTENGGVYVDTTDIDNMDRYYRNCKANEFRGLGYPLPKYTEVVPEWWDTFGQPILDAKTQTVIPGLFAAGQGNVCALSFGSGFLAGRNAAERVKGVDWPKITWSKVQDALNTAYAALESQPAKAIRPLVPYHNIQRTLQKGCGFRRDEAGIKATIAELERIKAEEIPAMTPVSKSRRFNTEWRQALEVSNMWNVSMATAQASLVRKECRMYHMRTDYPKTDNANYLKNVVVSLKDGKWTAELKPIDFSVLPEEKVKAMVGEFSLMDA